MTPGDPPAKPSPPAARRRWRRALTIISWVYLVAAVGLWLLLQKADQWWPATFVMFSPRWIFALPLVVFLPIAAYARSRSVVVLLIAAVVVGGPVTNFNVPWRQLTRSTPRGPSIRVMTLNMHYSKADPSALDDFIASQEPEIVAIQEWPGVGRSAIRFDPGWNVHVSPRLFLASRHPICQATELGQHSTDEHASAMHYELESPVGLIHVFSLHTASDRSGIADTIHGLRKGPGEIQTNSARRREQCAFVASKAAACQGPVLVLGDFNTPPESPIFPEVWTGYTDAFSSSGWGWGYTFLGAKTTVRIDHVLLGSGWYCTRCRVGPWVGSPHRPVIADLVRE